MSRLGVDLDGTLTQGDKRYWEERCDPDPEIIEKINNLYKQGHTVLIWTARPWSNAQQVASWLTEHGVRYHGLRMDKGSADVYIDDKAVHVNEENLTEKIQDMIK